MKMAVIWIVAPCSLVEVYRRFGGAFCLHYQGDIKTDLEERVCGMASCGSGQGPVAGCREHGNEPLGSIKCGKFLEQLSYY
jgi:hypothetical protein